MLAGRPAPRPLRHRRRGGAAPGRRYAVSARLSRLFAAYAVQRPTLLADWLEGRASDGRGGDLEDDLAWQPELSRRLVDRVGAPPPHRRHGDTLTRLRDSPEAFELPDRLFLFGTPGSRSPRSSCSTRWPRAATYTSGCHTPAARSGRPSPRPPAAPSTGPRTTATTPPTTRCWPPWPATAAELQRALAAAPAHDEHTPMPAAPDTLLARRYDDLRANTLAPAGRTPAAGDRSDPRCTPAHGAARQVDVLREVLLGMLEADPTLEPRRHPGDVPRHRDLLRAADHRRLRPGDLVDGGHPAHRLRVRLADRSLGQTNPLLGVAAQLLDLAGSRAPSARCSTCPGRTRSAAGSGSPTTTSTRSPPGPRVRCPLGLRPGAPRRLRPDRLPAEHLAHRTRPGGSAGW